MSALWGRWVAFLTRPEPVVGLAVFRVLLGLVLAQELLSAWWVGVPEALWRVPEDGGIGPLTPGWRFDLLGGATPSAVDGVLAATVVAALAVSAGLFTRLSAFVALQGFLALMFLNPPCGGGHDRLITNALWIVALSPAGASASVDALLRTGRWLDPTPRASWPRRVLGLQIVCCYTFAGLGKIGPEWWPWGGLQAVYYAVLQPQWGERDATFVAWAFPLTQVATTVTIAFESLFFLVPVWMWGRHRWPSWRRLDLRIPFLLLGLAMHGALELFMNLGPFALISVSYYFLLFDADEYATALRRLRASLPWSRTAPDVAEAR